MVNKIRIIIIRVLLDHVLSHQAFELECGCSCCDKDKKRVSLLGSIHFLEGGGGPEEFRGGSLTFCLPKKGGSA